MSHKCIIIIFISLFLCASAYAQSTSQNSNGGYVVKPFDPQKNPELKNNGVGAQGPISFWQLPLNTKIMYILAILSTGSILTFSFIKLFPIISGRLKHALDNPKTKKIYSFIQTNPGITVSELSKEQKMNRGTLKYHLGQLLTNNKIMSVRKGKYLRLFYNNPRAVDKESTISRYLKNDKNQAFLFTIMDNPGITNQDLSQKFNLDKSTVTDYLKKFFNDDIIEYRQDGKFKRCYLTQDSRIIILRYRPQ